MPTDSKYSKEKQLLVLIIANGTHVLAQIQIIT